MKCVWWWARSFFWLDTHIRSVDSMLVLLTTILAWCAHSVLCYFIVRPIRSTLIRALLTFWPCVLLTGISCHNLPVLWTRSLCVVAICWHVSIRLVHLTAFSDENNLTFRSFASRMLWIFLPLVPCSSTNMAWSIIYDLVFASAKLIINHWIYQWFLRCEPKDTNEQMMMFYFFIQTIPYLADFERVLIRVITGNRYTIEAFTDFTSLSRSLRTFWGRRYNRIVSIFLKASVFQPILTRSSSATLAGLSTFIISGLFHVHIVLVVFDDTSYAMPTFLFFLIHGLACSLETHMKVQMLEHVGWLLTHFFLLITSSMVLKPFMANDLLFFRMNPPPLLDVEWIPRLPVSCFSLK